MASDICAWHSRAGTGLGGMVAAISNLVFQGGGVKGIAYAGALAALERRGVLSAVKGTAGASAGAFTAMLVAVGCDAAAIARIATGTDYRSLEDHFDPLRLATHYGLYRGEALHAWIAGAFASTGLDPRLDFDALAARTGRDLRVFATDLSHRTAREFSARATPRVAVVDAVRASMSIPLMFPAWRFPAGEPDDHLYVDGGVVMNYPIAAFDEDAPVDATLGFRLVPGSQTVPIPGDWNHPAAYVHALFGAILAAQAIDVAAQPRDRLRSVAIDDFGIAATGFRLTAAQQQDLFESGRRATDAFLDARASRPGAA
jgi:NTE family protein